MNKVYLKRTLGFIFTGIILIGLCEMLFARYSDRLFVYDYLMKESNGYFEKRAKDVDVIFLGHSHVFYGINPDSIKLTGHTPHNFAFASERIGSTFYKVKYYLERGYMPNLKVAVILMQYASIADPNDSMSNMAYNYSRFYDYFDILKNNEIKVFFPVLANSFNMVRLHPDLQQITSDGYFERRNDFLKREILMGNGYCRRESAFSEDSLESEKQQILKWSLRDEKINRVKVSYYKRLVELFKKHGVRVVFIQMPTPAIIIARKESQAIDFNKYDLLEKKTEQFIKTSFPGIPSLNYNRSDVDWRLEFFSDRGHLNAKGADFLGSLLSKDLVAYLK